MEREYIGIDLHKAFFQACAMTSSGGATMGAAMADERRGHRGACWRGVGRAVTSRSKPRVPTWAFVDRIVEHVGAIQVVDTRKTRIKAGYAAKTDRLDAQRLADALRRDSVVGIYYPPPAIRDLRELGRYRCHLARLQASLKQRIHALLLRQGVDDAARAVHAARHVLARRRWCSPGWAGDELRGLRQVLADVRRQLAPVMTAIRAVGGERSDRARVRSTPGIRAGVQRDRAGRSRRPLSGFRMGRTWPVTRAWCPGWSAVAGGSGADGLPRRGRRGCDGR